MTYACSDLVACPRLQQGINATFGMNPELLTEQVQFLKFITSGVNRTGILQNQIDQGNARRRMVELVYQPREVDGSSSSAVGNDCAGGAEPCNLSQIYEIDETVGSSIKWSIELDNLEEMCEADESFFARQVMRQMDLLSRDMNMRTAMQAATLIGNTPAGIVSPVVCNFYQDSTRPLEARTTDAIERIDYAFTEMEWMGNVVTFGGSFPYKSYWRHAEIDCCNVWGDDLVKMMQAHQIVPFYDRHFQNYLLAPDNFIGMIPGALQLLTFNKHRGSKYREIDAPQLKRGVLAHPNPDINILFDFYAELDCNVWKFYLGVAHHLVAAPADMFFTGDRLSGINGVVEFAPIV